MASFPVSMAIFHPTPTGTLVAMKIMVTFHSAGDPAADFATTAAMLGKL